MNHWPRRLIYLIVVVGTAGFAFYQYKQSQKEELEEEKKDLIFSSLESSEVQSVSIEKEEGKQNIHFFRQNEGWQMDSPVQDIADRDLIGDWLEGLFAEKIKVIKEKGVDWTEYGLDENLKFIEITTRSNKKFKLDISHYSAFDGSIYIRRGEELLLGGTAWAHLADKPWDYFRSYKLLNIGKHPTGLHYKSKLFTAHLKWDNYIWKWAEKDSAFPLSQSALESYWSFISNVGFEKEIYPDTEKFKKKFQLLIPDIELNMEFEENKSWSVKISSKIGGKFYVLVSTRGYIFTLNKEQKEKVLLLEKNIRDHRQPFQFKKDQAHFMDIKGYGLDIQLKKEKEKWVLLGEDNELERKSELNKEKKNTEKELNSEEVENVLNRTTVLSAGQYFGKEKSFAKTAHLILKDKEEKVILKLEFSEPFELKTKKEDTKKKSQVVYARSSAGQEVMTVRFENLKFVFSSSLLWKDEKENKEEKIKKN